MKSKIIIASFVYALSTGLSAAQDKIFVEALTPGKNGKLVVFDEKGAKVGEYASDAFETPPFPARGYDQETRKVKVMVDGREVWLSPFQVKTSEKASVLTDCQAVQRTSRNSGGQENYGTRAGKQDQAAYSSRGVNEKCK